MVSGVRGGCNKSRQSLRFAIENVAKTRKEGRF
jgi:hypothetical protein